MEKIAVIILNYNNSSDTINCMKSVEKYNTADIKYIIIDNGSTKKTVIEELHSFFCNQFPNRYRRLNGDTCSKQALKLPYVTFLVNSDNDGYACGNNKGLDLAYRDTEITKIMILNSDILFVDDIIPLMIQDIDSIPGAAIVSPVLYKKGLKEIDYTCCRKAPGLTEIFLTYIFAFVDIFGIISRMREKRNVLHDKKLPLKNPIVEIELPSGSCMLLNKDLFRSIGSFDPHTFLYYEEDILYQKIKNLHMKNYLDTRLSCIHLGATTTKNSPSSFIWECNYKSAYYYLSNYMNASSVYLAIIKYSFLIMKLKLFIKRAFSFCR